MAGRNWLLLGIAASVLGGPGCISAGYKGARLAREAGPECDIPLTQRNQVYVFVIGGNNPLESSALDRFREGLNAQGFAKVATGPSIYSSWMASEMRRIHSEQPTAVFVIAGLDDSAPAAVKLSEKAAAEGLPVHGVVIADPTGKTSGPRGGLRTLFLQSSSPRTDNTARDERLSEVVQLLNDVALRSPLPFDNSIKESTYPFATDTLISVEPKQDSEWDFMFDRVGSTTRGIADPLPPRPITANNSTAGK